MLSSAPLFRRPSHPMSDRADKPKQSHGFVRRHGTKLVASAVITAGILYTLQKGGLTLVPEGANFQQVRWWTLPLYLLMLGAMSYFRAVRWRFLLRSFADVPRRRVL